MMARDTFSRIAAAAALAALGFGSVVSAQELTPPKDATKFDVVEDFIEAQEVPLLSLPAEGPTQAQRNREARAWEERVFGVVLRRRVKGKPIEAEANTFLDQWLDYRCSEVRNFDETQAMIRNAQALMTGRRLDDAYFNFCFSEIVKEHLDNRRQRANLLTQSLLDYPQQGYPPMLAAMMSSRLILIHGYDREKTKPAVITWQTLARTAITSFVYSIDEDDIYTPQESGLMVQHYREYFGSFPPKLVPKLSAVWSLSPDAYLRDVLRDYSLSEAQFRGEVDVAAMGHLQFFLDGRESYWQGDLAQARKTFESIGNFFPEQGAASRLVDLELSLVDIEERLAKGETVPLEFRPDLPGWDVRSGEWTVTKSGELQLKFGPQTGTFRVIHRARLGKNFEMTGEFSFDTLRSQHLLFGPMVGCHRGWEGGEQWLSCLCEREFWGKFYFDLLGRTFASNFKGGFKPLKVADNVFRFRVTVKDGKVSYWMNDLQVIKDHQPRF